MLLPLLTRFGLSALPGLFKMGTGIAQLGRKVERVDTTPAAFRESVALGRQAAGSAQLPGMGLLQNRLAQSQAATVQNARLGAGSSADFLATVGAADTQRQQGEVQLGAQGQVYRDQATQRLSGLLREQAGYQAADDNRYNQAKATLKQGGLTNLFGGLSDVASAGVYAGTQAKSAEERAAERLLALQNSDNAAIDPRQPVLNMPAPPAYAPPAYLTPRLTSLLLPARSRRTI